MHTVLLRLFWIALLLLPNATVLAFANAWETDPGLLGLTSLGVVILLYGLLPWRGFLAVTCPIIIAGAIVVGVDWQASVNVLDLVAVANTFKAEEIVDAARPYAAALVLCILCVLGLMVALWRAKTPSMMRGRAQIGLACAGIGAVVALPAHTWLAAWPVSLLPAIASSQSLDVGLQLSNLPNKRVSPRDRFQSWHASRKHAPADSETYVLVIGETVRSDRMNGCGGRPEVTAPAADALLYCDMLAGSNGSHVAVPLMISRELPGHVDRVSRDSTFQRAFEEVGFETFWLAVQDKSIAWPDARNQSFDPSPGLDRDLLMPQLEQALARPARRKMIVLHAYNAHSPYVDRYRVGDAPFPVDVTSVDSNREMRWNAYDNAIDESMRFLNGVVERLRAEPGLTFLVYAPDHAENMQDDHRRLLNHALKFPTLWDTRVPAVVWANANWRQAHPEKWRTLALNKDKGLMHMDIVPTLLGAAQIDYAEPRSLPIDLTSRVVSPRRRITQTRAGQTADLESLYREAGQAAVPAASD